MHFFKYSASIKVVFDTSNILHSSDISSLILHARLRPTDLFPNILITSPVIFQRQHLLSTPQEV